MQKKIITHQIVGKYVLLNEFLTFQSMHKSQKQMYYKSKMWNILSYCVRHISQLWNFFNDILLQILKIEQLFRNKINIEIVKYRIA